MENRVHILLVDDELRMLKTMHLVLTSEGYQVSWAADGAQALQVMQTSAESNDPISMVITDIHMPGMSGLELIDELSRKNFSVPVIAITGYGDQSVRLNVFAKGCADYLDKPFTRAELLQKVNDIARRLCDRVEVRESLS